MANVRWTPTDLQFIRENVEKMTDDEGAKALSERSGKVISKYAWRKKRQQLGFKKLPGRGVCKMAPVNKKILPF